MHVIGTCSCRRRNMLDWACTKCIMHSTLKDPEEYTAHTTMKTSCYLDDVLYCESLCDGRIIVQGHFTSSIRIKTQMYQRIYIVIDKYHLCLPCSQNKPSPCHTKACQDPYMLPSSITKTDLYFLLPIAGCS